MKFILASFILLLMIITTGHTQEFRFSLSSGDALQRTDRILMLGTGVLIFGESLLLLIGMNLPEVSSWSTPENLVLAASDLLLGGALSLMALFHSEPEEAPLLYLCCGLLMITHLWRDAAFGRTEEPFCANTPLFVMNNVRMGLVAGVTGFSLFLQF